jgi:hypothetical protein
MVETKRIWGKSVKAKAFTKVQVEAIKRLIEEETTVELSVGVFNTERKKKASIKQILEKLMLKGDIYICYTPDGEDLLAYDKKTHQVIYL